MPPRERRTSNALTRADLPAELTPDSLRHLDLRRLGQLRRPDNGVLTADEQVQFDAAFDTVLREVRERLHDADGRSRRGGPRGLDPEMRRSYQRTQQRLQDQTRRARQALPELGQPEDTDTASIEPTAPEPESSDDDVSAEGLTKEIEEASTTLELLDRIATIQQQQLEHQETRLLTETRGIFFAFLVSVSVIIAGVAPLVEAEPHDRLLILLWTLAACVVAGVVYALVRARENSMRSSRTDSADESA